MGEEKTVPMTFRVETKTQEIMERCVELTGSTKTELFRRAMRGLLRKLEREAASDGSPARGPSPNASKKR